MTCLSVKDASVKEPLTDDKSAQCADVAPTEPANRSEIKHAANAGSQRNVDPAKLLLFNGFTVFTRHWIT